MYVFFMFDIISLFCRLVNTFLAIYYKKAKKAEPAFKNYQKGIQKEYVQHRHALAANV